MDNIENTKINITGEVTRIVYSNDETGFRVFKINTNDNQSLSVVAKTVKVRVGESVRCIGEFEQNRFGTQLKADSVSIDESNITKDGLAQSLCGLVKGFGPARANKLIDYYGGPEELIKELDINDPEYPGSDVISLDLFNELICVWKDSRVEREIEAQLASLDLSPGIRTKLRAKYGSNALNIIMTDPYRIPFEVDGIGFLTADDIAIKVNVGIHSTRRIDAAVYYSMSEASTSEGHTRLELQDIIKYTCNLFMKRTAPSSFANSPSDACMFSLQRLIADEEVIDCLDNSFSLKTLYESEDRIARGLARLAASVVDGPPMTRSATDGALQGATGTNLTEEQSAAVTAAIEKGLLVITGGPGVGKTTTCKAIVDTAINSNLKIRLCAPTARAAKRLFESTKYESTTIHRLLDPQGASGRFSRNKDNPIDADLILADESSMIDSLLMASLLDAIQDGCRLILVGDYNQLPPVGAGAPFRDIINSESIYVARLTKIHRQAEGSSIVKSSHNVLRGYSPVISPPGDRSNGCLHTVEVDTDNAANAVLNVLSSTQSELDCDPWDVIVLSPMRKGSSGVNALNKSIQAVMNPPSEDKGERIVGTNESERVFRLGDRVRQTKNDYNRGIVNGDIGRIVLIETREMLKDETVVSVDFGYDVGVVNYNKEQLNHLVLSYCGTIHSVQGSEAPVVILVLTNAHYIMLTRTLLYTAITRAKRACIIVGSKRAIAIAAGNAKDDGRKTVLKSMLKDYFQ